MCIVAPCIYDSMLNVLQTCEGLEDTIFKVVVIESPKRDNVFIKYLYIINHIKIKSSHETSAILSRLSRTVHSATSILMM